MLFRSDQSSDLEVTTPQDDLPAVTSTLGPPDRTEEFLDAYEASFDGPYALTGEFEFANADAATRQQVRRARVDDRSLDQVGSGAVVTRDGELRRCSDDGTQFLCTQPEPEPTPASRRNELADELVKGDGFTVAQKADGCFLLTANGDGTFSLFGFETTYCFDAETGAISSKITVKGRRTESFIAQSITAQVTEDDLTPM